jgi:hypothetical protein
MNSFLNQLSGPLMVQMHTCTVEFPVTTKKKRIETLRLGETSEGEGECRVLRCDRTRDALENGETTATPQLAMAVRGVDAVTEWWMPGPEESSVLDSARCPA